MMRPREPKGALLCRLGTSHSMEQDLITDGRYRYVQSATEGTPWYCSTGCLVH